MLVKIHDSPLLMLIELFIILALVGLVIALLKPWNW